MGANVSAVLAEVATKIEGSTSSVRQRVVDTLVEKEVSFRADLLDKSLLKLAELRKSFDKMRPDNTTYDTTGNPTSTYSKKAWDERKQAEDRLNALDKALEAVLGKNEAGDYMAKKEDWSKLREALEKAGKGGGEKKAEDSQ